MMGWVEWILLTVLILTTYIFFIRNGCVFRIRNQIRDKIHQHNVATIKEGRFDDKQIGYDMPDKIFTYEQMTFKFWIPLRTMKKRLWEELDKLIVIKLSEP